MSAPRAMDHAEIEAGEVVERYLRDRLSQAELERFEAHYLGCAECLDRLDLAEAMSRGFRRAAAQDAVRLAASRQLAVVAWLARLGRSRQAAVLAGALLVAVALPAVFGVRAVRERDRAAQRVEAADAQAGRAEAGAHAAAAEAERLRSELDRAAGELAAAQAPRGNVPILFLAAQRGGPGEAAGEPAFRLRLPAAQGPVVLAPEVDPPHPAAYRAILLDPAGRELWRGDGLSANEMDALTLSVPSALLAPGDHTLLVERLPASGPPVAAGRFVFRVLPR